MEGRLFYIYRHTSRDSGKAYIGITCTSVANRWSAHCSDTKHGSMLPFHRAIRRYGREAFETTLVATAYGLENALRAERLAIAVCGTLVPKGYNVSEGGQGTEGVPCTPRRRAEVSKQFSGIPKSKDHRQRISKAHMGKPKPWMLGRPSLKKGVAQGQEWADKSRVALRKAHTAWKGSKQTDEAKQRMRYTKSRALVVHKDGELLYRCRTTLRALAMDNDITATALCIAMKKGVSIKKPGPLHGCVITIDDGSMGETK